MKKAVFVIIACVLAVTFIISGCSSRGKSDMAVSTTASTGAYSPYNGKAETGYDDGGYGGEVKYETQDNQADIKKVIKTGEIAVEVNDVDKAYDDIKKILGDIGGYEFNINYRIRDEYKRIQLVVKIPPDKLEDFKARLAEYVGDGHISEMVIRSEDISSQYYDVEARLESYKKSRDQIRELLEKAQTVEEVLKIQSELTRLQADIDAMQGKINMWDKLVDMATITLYIDEIQDPLKHTKTVGWRFNSASQVWMAMRNGFVNTINVAYSIIVWICVAIVSLLPVIVPAGIVVWFVVRRRKNRSKES